MISQIKKHLSAGRQGLHRLKTDGKIRWENLCNQQP